MKKIALLFLLFPLLAQAQVNNFAPLGATWHYQSFHNSYSHKYTKAKVEKDTLIEGKIVSKLSVYSESGTKYDGAFYLWYDKHKVFFYEDKQFKLLYDFNLKKGDTLVAYIPKNWKILDINCAGGGKLDIPKKNVIDSVYTKKINGIDIKFQKTRPITNKDNYWNRGDISEKFADISGFMGSGTGACLGGFPGYIRCYQEPGFSYKFVTENCERTDFENSVSDINDFSFQISPNPAQDFVELTWKTPISGSIKIYDSLGRLVSTANINLEETQKTINVSFLPKGICFFIIVDENAKLVFRNKVEIEK